MNADSEMNKLERDLETLFGLPEPDRAFAVRLQNKLAAAAAERQKPSRRPAAWPALRIALAAVLLVIVAAVLAIGPQKVWALTVHWLSGGTGFNTDVGFAPADATLELAAPVSVSRGSAVFEMGDVLFIQNEDAALNYTIKLDPAVYAELQKYPIGPAFPAQTMQQVMLPYTRYAFENRIDTPAGLRLKGQGGMAYLEDGKLVSRQMYATPGDRLYTRYELVLPFELCELIGAGEGEWVIPFELKPVEMIHPRATDQTTPGATAQPQPAQPEGAVYQPTQASLPISAFNIQMTDVAVTPQETAVRLEMMNREYNFQTLGIDGEYIHLADETGREYARIEKDAQNDDMYQSTFFFEALQPGVRQLKLTIDMVYLMTTFPNECIDPAKPCTQTHLEYTVKSEQAVQPGMTLTPGQTMEIANFPGGVLTLDRVEIMPRDGIMGAALVINADWRSLPAPATKLVSVAGNIHLQPGEEVNGCGGVSHSGQPLGDGLMRESYVFTPLDGSQSAIQTFYLDVCAWEVEYSGPWVIKWDIPPQ